MGKKKSSESKWEEPYWISYWFKRRSKMLFLPDTLKSRCWSTIGTRWLALFKNKHHNSKINTAQIFVEKLCWCPKPSDLSFSMNLWKQVASSTVYHSFSGESSSPVKSSLIKEWLKKFLCRESVIWIWSLHPKKRFLKRLYRTVKFL